MALVTEKSVFLHIPKTGGIWIRHAFYACKIHYAEVGKEHTHFPELLELKPHGYYNDRFIFAFVRHPLAWYQSRWAFRIKSGWCAAHPLDYNCASNDFRTFVDNALKYRPTGWVTKEYNNYINTIPRQINYVGRTENIVEDTLESFKLAGEKYDEKIIRSIIRANDSDLDGKPSKYWATYTPELADRVMKVEHEIIERYYNNSIVNPADLCGPRRY
jgi:hypothetical protein